MLALLALLTTPAIASTPDDTTESRMKRPDKKATKPTATPTPRPGPDARAPSPSQSSKPMARPTVPRPAPSATTPAVRRDVVPRNPDAREPAESHSEVVRTRVRPETRPAGTTRPFDRSARATPAHRTSDHRYARPAPSRVRRAPHASHPPPDRWHYRPRYAHWWVHPYYRHVHATVVVVWFPFWVHPWAPWWAPPARPGWVWVPGYWAHGHFHPGHWRPVGPPPARYVYVSGWWQGDIYVEGWWRRQERGADWVWVDGYYLNDDTYVPGYWRPAFDGPDGYVWEPGFFDGETWVEGFWRPRFYEGYTWVSAWFDEDGVYHMGYWEPVVDRPGHVWIPGWFDGNEWVQGYWVTEAEYRAEDPARYAPDEGWDDGWDAPVEAPEEDALAIPVE